MLDGIFQNEQSLNHLAEMKVAYDQALKVGDKEKVAKIQNEMVKLLTINNLSMKGTRYPVAMAKYQSDDKAIDELLDKLFPENTENKQKHNNSQPKDEVDQLLNKFYGNQKKGW